jgi:hypothetical protein
MNNAQINNLLRTEISKAQTDLQQPQTEESTNMILIFIDTAEKALASTEKRKFKAFINSITR